MPSLINFLLVMVLVLNLVALGSSRLRAVIRIVALQGIILSVLPLILHRRWGLEAAVVSLAAVLLKGMIIPGMLMRALEQAKIKREVEPLIGLLPSMLLGAAATGSAILLTAGLPVAGTETAPLLIPASLATVMVGFILLTTRFKALSQVIGYLVLENGVFIFGMLLFEAMPAVVEMGVLLDLFVATFIICIIVNHINRAFSSLDTRRLAELRE